MEHMQCAKQMMDIFKASLTMISDTLDTHDGEKQNGRNVQKVHESPDELGYRVGM